MERQGVKAGKEFSESLRDRVDLLSYILNEEIFNAVQSTLAQVVTDSGSFNIYLFESSLRDFLRTSTDVPAEDIGVSSSVLCAATMMVVGAKAASGG